MSLGLGQWPASLAAESPTPPSIRLNDKAGRQAPARFEVVGLSPAMLAQLSKAKWDTEQWHALFAVRVASNSAEGTDQPAVLGAYRIDAGVLCFEPRFPVEPGIRYRAVFEPSRLPGAKANQPSISAEFLLPRPVTIPTTVVEHVYPSTDRLPENQLKFYLHFTAPMSRGEAYRHIHLLDAAGKEVELPFLELGEELWDARGQRFTLFFDPGRIKRGLKPREEVGPALEEGKSYTLLIDRDWHDARGNPLKDDHRKSFRAGPPDDQAIDPQAWKLQPPAVGERGVLDVTFPKPLDHALLQRVLWVTDAQDRPVAGQATISQEETRWHFTPERPWKAGTYRLVADTVLEDLAGNSIGKPFEIDVFHPIEHEVKTKTIQLPFTVADRASRQNGGKPGPPGE